MNLFNSGAVVLSSGLRSSWIIDCNALSPEDWASLAAMAAERLPPFGRVEGVPRGGLRFAAALEVYATSGCDTLLIVDDVGTTGGSLERHRGGRTALCLVVFKRGPLPPWIGYMSDLSEPFFADPKEGL